ncbi:hypothetical protein J6590_091307 [Homalodisca vitripennis]|nr:hypothetical protein J6590_091307 [Homalodisca vitripennis]
MAILEKRRMLEDTSAGVLKGLKRLTADNSSTTVRKYAVPGFLALSVAVSRSLSFGRCLAVEVVESESPPPHTPR